MDLEDILTCCICLDTVVAPKTLPCQHTFCKDPCLQSLIQNESVLCPLCRNTFAVPVNGFPTNYVMEQCDVSDIRIKNILHEVFLFLDYCI